MIMASKVKMLNFCFMLSEVAERVWTPATSRRDSNPTSILLLYLYNSQKIIFRNVEVADPVSVQLSTFLFFSP